MNHTGESSDSKIVLNLKLWRHENEVEGLANGKIKWKENSNILRMNATHLLCYVVIRCLLSNFNYIIERIWSSEYVILVWFWLTFVRVEQIETVLSQIMHITCSALVWTGFSDFPFDFRLETFDLRPMDHRSIKNFRNRLELQIFFFFFLNDVLNTK